MLAAVPTRCGQPKHRVASSTFLVGLLALSSGCDEADVDVTLSLRSVTRDGVVLDVKTEPGLLLSQTVALKGEEPKSDAEGLGSVTIPSTDKPEKFEGSRPKLFVQVTKEGLISEDPGAPFGGPKRVGFGSIEVDFELAKLKTAPATPVGPWLHLVSPLPPDAPNCLMLDAAVDGTSIGDGWSPVGGMVFLGQPGTQATIAGIAFEVDSTGLGAFKPTPAAMFPLLMAPVSVRAGGEFPVRIEHDGQDPVAVNIPFQLRAGCSQPIREHLLQRVSAGEPLLEGTAPAGDFAVVLKADGSIESQRPTVRKRLRAKRPDLAPVLLGSARYLAVEVETSRETGPECTKYGERDAGVVNNQDMVYRTQATFDPVFIETEFKLVDLTDGKELARKSFSPDRTTCQAFVYPSWVLSDGWVGDQMAEHKGGGAK